MRSHVMRYPSLHAPRARPFFSARTAQHVRRLPLVAEVVRATLALGNLIVWASLLSWL